MIIGRPLSRLVRAAALAVAVAGIDGLVPAPASATIQPDYCFPGWSEAVPVVRREALTSVRDLHAQARMHNIGDVVRITLCSDQGRFTYHLLVREPLGRVVPMTVDAHHPFAP